ncbi:MAG: hypothetical protein DDT22_01142 [candidate division WS2 bacterium]|nr:hypothetical protein [Candidatus Lithacetigena glycinireducens]
MKFLSEKHNILYFLLRAYHILGLDKSILFRYTICIDNSYRNFVSPHHKGRQRERRKNGTQKPHNRGAPKIARRHSRGDC